MPTYQYACPDCGNKFELKQKFTEDPIKICPRCQRRHVYRVVGPVAVSFKGSGWYITDSKPSSEKHTLEHKPAEATASANGAGETASAGTEKGDNTEKAETRTEAKPSEPASKTPEKSTTANTNPNHHDTKPAKKDKH